MKNGKFKTRKFLKFIIPRVLILVIILMLIPWNETKKFLGENVKRNGQIEEKPIKDETEEILKFARKQDFNKEWKFYWAGDSKNPGLEITGAENIEYNDSTWKDVNLPHDYSMEIGFMPENTIVGSEAGFMPGGTGWYRKKFIVPESSKDKRIYIRFGGVI